MRLRRSCLMRKPRRSRTFSPPDGAGDRYECCTIVLARPCRLPYKRARWSPESPGRGLTGEENECVRPERRKQDGMNIFVGNLSYQAGDEDLRSAFAAFGQVTSANVIVDRMTGKSRGFGFVEMPNREEAQAAIQALNDQPLKGRPIKVNEARPREARPPRFEGRDRF